MIKASIAAVSAALAIAACSSGASSTAPAAPLPGQASGQSTSPVPVTWHTNGAYTGPWPPAPGTGTWGKTAVVHVTSGGYRYRVMLQFSPMLHFAIPAAGQGCGRSGASDLMPGTYGVVIKLTEANLLSQGSMWTGMGVEIGGNPALVASIDSSEWTWQGGSCGPPSFGPHGQATTYTILTELDPPNRMRNVPVAIDGGAGQRHVLPRFGFLLPQ